MVFLCLIYFSGKVLLAPPRGKTENSKRVALKLNAWVKF